jgi:dTDP-4-amino-4,6-dideoxygalactose transaminase
MGGQFGYKSEDLPITEDLAMRLVRLPFYTDLYENGLDYCIYNMSDVLKLIYQ